MKASAAAAGARASAGTGTGAGAGYDPAYFATIAAIERRHFWFRARNRVLRTALASLRDRLPARGRVLEVGCGTGNTLRVLEEACPSATIVGMDLFAEGLRFARQGTRAGLLQGRIEAAPFRTRFHLIGLFDVLEHIERDDEALGAVRNLLEPDGHLVLTVPAGPHLWSAFDVAAHHCRRYTRATLVARLADAGLAPQRVTPFMTAVYPLVWSSRRLARRARAEDADAREAAAAAEAELRLPPAWLNALLDASLRPEEALLRAGTRLPFGSSLLAIATRQ